jgi:hypothetical protein
MVTSEVWKNAQLGLSDACCLSCLEQRLHRSVEYRDFDWRFPINLFLPFPFESDEGLLILLRELARNLQRPEHALDGKLEALREVRERHPNGMTMPESTAWIDSNLSNLYHHS